MTEVASSCGSSATRESRRHWSANLPVIPFPHRASIPRYLTAYLLFRHIISDFIHAVVVCILLWLSCMFYHISLLPSSWSYNRSCRKVREQITRVLLERLIVHRHWPKHETLSGEYLQRVQWPLRSQHSILLQKWRRHIFYYVNWLHLWSWLDLLIWFDFVDAKATSMGTADHLHWADQERALPVLATCISWGFLVWHSGSFWNKRWCLSDSGSLGLGW